VDRASHNAWGYQYIVMIIYIAVIVHRVGSGSGGSIARGNYIS